MIRPLAFILAMTFLFSCSSQVRLRRSTIYPIKYIHTDNFDYRLKVLGVENNATAVMVDDDQSLLYEFELDIKDKNYNTSTLISKDSLIYFQSFKFAEHIKAQIGLDTLDCVHFIGERYYDVTPTAHFFFSFIINKNSFRTNDSFRIIIRENQYYNPEVLSFLIN